MRTFWRIALGLVVVVTLIVIGTSRFGMPNTPRRLAEEPPKAQQVKQQQKATYVGSVACGRCHGKQLEGWKKHFHSQMLQDVKAKPQAIVGDWAKPGAPANVVKSDVVYTVGGKWLQRYLVKRGNDYYAAPAEWVVKTTAWRAYSGTRSLRETCQHCLTTGSTVNAAGATSDFKEPGIGCEACHGPGSRHVKSSSAEDIVNPRELAYEREIEVCGQCHARGTSKAANGKYEDPRGFKPGDQLAKFVTFLAPQPGKETAAWFADGAAKQHHQQYQEFIQSKHYTSRKVSCRQCHPSHAAEETVKDNSVCGLGGCHKGLVADVKAHTQKAAGRTDVTLCVTCHMPVRATSTTEAESHSHTFPRRPVGLKTVKAEPYRS